MLWGRKSCPTLWPFLPHTQRTKLSLCLHNSHGTSGLELDSQTSKEFTNSFIFNNVHKFLRGEEMLSHFTTSFESCLASVYSISIFMPNILFYSLLPPIQTITFSYTPCYIHGAEPPSLPSCFKCKEVSLRHVPIVELTPAWVHLWTLQSWPLQVKG